MTIKRYAVKHPKREKILAILNYDEKKREYTIDIPDNVSESEAPFMLGLLMKKGYRRIDPEWSMKWVQCRVTPRCRHNIGEILRKNGMKRYDVHELLVRSCGRCCQDDYYIVPIEEK